MTSSCRQLMAVVAGILSSTCSESCPPGYSLGNHVCTAAPDNGTGGSTTTDASAQNDAGRIDGTCTDLTFGKTCTSAADCGCDTGYCAGYPGQAGICSHTGCLQDPTVCPAGWPCQDFSAYQAGLSLCTPP
jgi:hypothetical protein